MARIRLLRERLGWSQKRMGDYLGIAQSAVFRMENGQRERGPIAKLLDRLEGELATGAPVDGSQPAPGPVGARE